MTDGALLPGSTMHAERTVLEDALDEQHQLQGQQRRHAPQCFTANCMLVAAAEKLPATQR